MTDSKHLTNIDIITVKIAQQVLTPNPNKRMSDVKLLRAEMLCVARGSL